MNLRCCVVLCLLALAACSRPPPAPPPPLLLSDDTLNAHAELSMTLAATLRADNAANARGTLVLSRDAQSLVLGAALDGLFAGTYHLTVVSSADCAVAAPGLLRTDFEAFTADAFGQAKFSQRSSSSTPLADFAGQTVHVYAIDESVGFVPAFTAPPLMCGVLEPLAR